MQLDVAHKSFRDHLAHCLYIFMFKRLCIAIELHRVRSLFMSAASGNNACASCDSVQTTMAAINCGSEDEDIIVISDDDDDNVTPNDDTILHFINTSH